MSQFQKEIAFKLCLISAAIGAYYPLPALAGGDNGGGNGGGAIVCRDTQGATREAFMLDLWEGANLPQVDNGEQPFVITTDPAISWEVQLDRALAKIRASNEYAYDHIVRRVTEIKQGLERKVLPVKMRRIQDSSDFAVPEIPGLDCQREQVANDSDTNGLVIRKAVWDSFSSETDRAALILHEGIYKTERDLGLRTGKSSDHARVVVARAFSDSPMKLKTLGDLAKVCGDYKITFDKNEGLEIKYVSVLQSTADGKGWESLLQFKYRDGKNGYLGQPFHACLLAGRSFAFGFVAHTDSRSKPDFDMHFSSTFHWVNAHTNAVLSMAEHDYFSFHEKGKRIRSGSGAARFDLFE